MEQPVYEQKREDKEKTQRIENLKKEYRQRIEQEKEKQKENQTIVTESES